MDTCNEAETGPTESEYSLVVLKAPRNSSADAKRKAAKNMCKKATYAISILLLMLGAAGLYWSMCKYFPIRMLCHCDQLKRSTRGVSMGDVYPWAEEINPTHNYMTNSWWRYARFTARSKV